MSDRRRPQGSFAAYLLQLHATWLPLRLTADTPLRSLSPAPLLLTGGGSSWASGSALRRGRLTQLSHTADSVCSHPRALPLWECSACRRLSLPDLLPSPQPTTHTCARACSQLLESVVTIHKGVAHLPTECVTCVPRRHALILLTARTLRAPLRGDLSEHPLQRFKRRCRTGNQQSGTYCMKSSPRTSSQRCGSAWRTTSRCSPPSRRSTPAAQQAP